MPRHMMFLLMHRRHKLLDLITVLFKYFRAGIAESINQQIGQPRFNVLCSTATRPALGPTFNAYWELFLPV
jgi:hypothetical protein